MTQHGIVKRPTTEIVVGPDHSEACAAMARAVNEALNGAPIGARVLMHACQSAGYDPGETVRSLCALGVLSFDEGRRCLVLGPLGRAIALSAYLFA